MTPVLAVDVDSTVWDAATPVARAVFEVTGERLDPARTSTWTRLLESYGEEATAEIHARSLAPGLIPAREPYPGAPGTLRRLRRERGVRLHFVTRNPFPEEIEAPLLAWLRRHFGAGVELTVATGEKLPVLRRAGAFGLVDDRPEDLARAADAGLWVAAKLQPWNRAFVAGRPDVRGFATWRDFPEADLAVRPRDGIS
ncbi:MAG: hypothetical protein AB1425_12870 [Actinomycetota bacterium]